MATNTTHTPTHGVAEEEAAEEEEAEGTTPTDIDGTPHQKPFSRPHLQRRGSFFKAGWTSSCCISCCLKPKTNTWEHPTNKPIMKRLEDKKGREHSKLELPNISQNYPPKNNNNIHTMET